MRLQFSKPQAEFYYSTAKSVAAVAGFGSGKTAIAMFRCTSSVFNFPKNDFLYVAPTLQLVKDIWYPAVEEYLDALKIKHHINRSDNIIKIKNHGKIYCRSMEHPKRLVGFEVLDAFLDELDILATEKAKEVFRKVKARCRQKAKLKKARKKYKKKYGVKKKNQMYISTTPEGYKATYEMFEEKPIKGSHLIQMSTYSNLHNLPEDYIDELMANYPPQLVEAYIMGLFRNLVNMPVWSSYDKKLNRSKYNVIGNEPLEVGMDFNVGRGCAVVYVDRKKIHADDRRHPKFHDFKRFVNEKGLIGETIDDNFIKATRSMYDPIYEKHAVDEIVETYDTPATIEVLKERYLNNHITVIPDATGENRKSVNATISDLSLLRQAGYKVLKNNKNPNRKDRVTAANVRFCNSHGERTVFVNDSTCPHYSKGLVKQIYDKNGMPEKGEGKFDDITDAGTYPIAKLFPIKKVTTKREDIF